MEKKGVEEMINEISIFIDNCKYQPLSSNKIVVPKDEIDKMLSELKLKLPNEIERCKKIMRNKEAILASARTRSDAIISESVNEANRLVETNHITELANIRANEILEQAKRDAQQILDDANAEASEVRLSAMEYTKTKLAEMRNYFARTLEIDRENYHNLIDSLENTVYTLDSNVNDMDASINLLTGNPIQAPVSQPMGQQYSDEDISEFTQDDYGYAPQKPAQQTPPVAPPPIVQSLSNMGDDDDEDYDEDYDDEDYDDDDDFLDE
ncbi:MAG: hypothetical protein IJJ74_02435 [Eubacterium sp.]|nr:hypothetical protein [Eubacterium sp.]